MIQDFMIQDFMIQDVMSGDGIFTREPGVLQPSARKLLEEVGSQEVKSIEIVRTPLSSFTKTFLNTISLGQFDKISKKYYDEMFHLSLWINGQYNLEKNEVVYFNTKNPKEKNSQVRSVTNIPSPLTIQQLIDNTRDRMGAENFSNYDAEKLNCQNFLINVFDANDIGDSADRDFIFQDATKIFKELPEYAKVLGKASVKLGAIFNRLMYGEGQSGGDNVFTGEQFRLRSEQSGDGLFDFLRTDKEKAENKKYQQDYTISYLTKQGNTTALDRYKKQQGLGSQPIISISRVNANGLMDGRIMEMRF
jgi:hypothetical protein